MEKEKIIQAGKITSEVKKYAKSIIKKGMPLLEIAEKIESKILELGAKPAFPVNLSINEIAAHYTPDSEDKTLAKGLLKIDLGVHIDGWAADTAFSIDLENNEENKKLIKSAENALENAIKHIKIEKENTPLDKIGSIIQKTIDIHGFNPITNLCGHSIEQFELHSGITIPNISNNNLNPIEAGIRAIEPFSTTGSGKVHDSKPSGIYSLIDEKNIRNPTARKILEFIKKEYKTLPFCERWITKQFGQISKLALQQLENNGNLHQYNQLTEIKGSKVAQAEHTLFIDDNVVVTTE